MKSLRVTSLTTYVDKLLSHPEIVNWQRHLTQILRVLVRLMLSFESRRHAKEFGIDASHFVPCWQMPRVKISPE